MDIPLIFFYVTIYEFGKNEANAKAPVLVRLKQMYLLLTVWFPTLRMCRGLYWNDYMQP
jgi:hypothetical protein